ncbi:MAG TPA: RNA 2',3'-cyclic phosphodiesterase [Roseiflexaceae bacterium]|nr:RNA 2',3'-cyclic phosphodiesterase [Roseiflexaceae bacterium]
MNYRLFIAAELPAAVKDALLAVQAQLRTGRPPVVWVAPEAMHLTLRFLGDTDATLVAPLEAAMHTALGGVSAPRLRLARASAFPGLARPRVLWVGVQGDTAALQQAHNALVRELDALGLPPADKPFAPHLTIGRVRRDAAPEELARLGERLRGLPPLEGGTWRVERITLFRSELRAGGAVHTPLASVGLKIED